MSNKNKKEKGAVSRFKKALKSKTHNALWDNVVKRTRSRLSRKAAVIPPVPVKSPVPAGGELHGTLAQPVTRAAAAPLKGLPSTLKHLGRTATVAGAAGVLAGATGEAYRNYGTFKGGDMSGSEYAGRVAVSAAESGVGVGGRTFAALAVQEGGKEVAKRVGGEALKRFAGSNVATAVAFGLVEQGIDTVHLARGTIGKREYGTRSVQTVGSTGGALGGAVVGATVGSAVPVLGTAIGALVGGVLGGIGGNIGGRRVGEKIFVEPYDDGDED